MRPISGNQQTVSARCTRQPIAEQGAEASPGLKSMDDADIQRLVFVLEILRNLHGIVRAGIVEDDGLHIEIGSDTHAFKARDQRWQMISFIRAWHQNT